MLSQNSQMSCSSCTHKSGNRSAFLLMLALPIIVALLISLDTSHAQGQLIAPVNLEEAIASPMEPSQPFLSLIDDVLIQSNVDGRDQHAHKRVCPECTRDWDRHQRSDCPDCSQSIDGACQAADHVVAMLELPPNASEPSRPRYSTKQLADVLLVSLQGSSQMQAKRRAIETALQIASEQGVQHGMARQRMAGSVCESQLRARIASLERQLASPKLPRDHSRTKDAQARTAWETYFYRTRSGSNLESLQNALTQLERDRLISQLKVPAKLTSSQCLAHETSKLETATKHGDGQGSTSHDADPKNRVASRLPIEGLMELKQEVRSINERLSRLIDTSTSSIPSPQFPVTLEPMYLPDCPELKPITRRLTPSFR